MRKILNSIFLSFVKNLIRGRTFNVLCLKLSVKIDGDVNRAMSENHLKLIFSYQALKVKKDGFIKENKLICIQKKKEEL